MKKRILVVEDEKIVAMEIQQRLTEMGFQVIGITDSGEDAIHQANELKPDLTLMDIRLKGGIDGIEAAEKIRSRYDIPVVYLTAFADDETVQRAKKTEPFGYILKPFEEREIFTTIEMALYKHQMEKKLKESEQWFSTTLTSISDGVIATDKNGKIIFMNPVAEKLTGWKMQVAMGLDLTEVFYIVDETKRNRLINPVFQVLETDHIAEIANSTILIGKDQSERLIEDSAAPIRDSQGITKGVVLVFRDVTQKRKLEMDLQKAQKLESIGMLAGGIAHDFNNILTAIIGNISLAKLDQDLNEELSEILTEVEKAADRAKKLTRQLLTFARGGAPLKRVVSIDKVLSDAVEFALRGSNVRCEIILPQKLLTFDVDPEQVTQAIYNIIMNAKEAMSEGGTIHVTMETIDVLQNDKLPLNLGRYIKISIIDSGIGIPRKHLPLIFDPYFSTKQKSTGLGLTIAYSIIKKHGGNILVESEIKKGSIFNIYLPLVETQEIEEAEEVAYIDKKGKFLIMDDEEFIRDIGQRLLTKYGHQVEIVSDGAEAIERYEHAKKLGQPFDAVILDLTVPGGMGGKETMEKLRTIDPQVKAIVSSGYSNDPIMSNFKHYGFIGVVTKPYKVEELLNMLQKILVDKEEV